jgi:hypothetical protein
MSGMSANLKGGL